MRLVLDSSYLSHSLVLSGKIIVGLLFCLLFAHSSQLPLNCSEPKSPLFSTLSFGLKFCTLCYKYCQLLWPSVFLKPASLTGYNLCTSTPWLGARTVICFFWSDTFYLWLGHWVKIIDLGLFNLLLLVWNQCSTSELGTGNWGPVFSACHN